MPTKHATLAPSSAERWLVCPASIKMETQVPRQGGSAYATEGTAAHALAELKARLEYGEISKRVYTSRRNSWRVQYAITPLVEAEMEEHTDAYIALVAERMTLYPMSQAMFEQRLQTGVPLSFGTSDTVIASPQHVEIIDFKYGQGVTVEAEGNPQLRLYALGALDMYGDILGDTEVVRMTVHQPRLNHTLTAEMTPDSIRAWRRDVVIPMAEEALSDFARFNPTEEACRWCPASGRCAAQLEKVTHQDFSVVPTRATLVSPEEVSELLVRVPEVRNWLSAFEEVALNMAYSEGKTIPGYKVVMSGGKRVIADSDGAIEHLSDAGFSHDEVANRKVKGIGELEKLLGKSDFATLMGAFISRTPGRPSLVLESDRRPPVAPHSQAAADFSEPMEEE